MFLSEPPSGPILVDTRDRIVEGHHRKQVIGFVYKEVKVDAHAVVEQIRLQADVELLGSLPLDLVVTDIGELETNGTVVEADAERLVRAA